MIEDIPVEPLLLAEVNILRELPQSELEYLTRQCPIVPLAEKESLILGEYQQGVILLLSGTVRVYEPTTFGTQDLTFSLVEGGTVVGQPASKPRPSRLEALEASVLMVLGLEDFEGLVVRNPRVELKTIRLFGERLDQYEGRLSNLIPLLVLCRGPRAAALSLLYQRREPHSAECA